MLTSAPQKTALEKGVAMTLIAAFLGWLLDGFELGLFPLD
jgi:hypothetical protein